jgi:hypothetical protein
LLRRFSLPLLAVLSVTPVYAVEPASPPAVIQALPADLPGLVLINTKDGSWSQLERFNASPLPLAFGLSFLLPPWLSFDNDIRPWLGDRVALALLPVAQGEKAGNFENHALMLAPVTNNEALQPLIEKLKANRGTPKSERSYKNGTILEWEPTKPPAPETPTLESRCLRSPVVSFLPMASQTCLQALPKNPVDAVWQMQTMQLRLGLLQSTIAQAPSPAPTPPPSETPVAPEAQPSPSPEPLPEAQPSPEATPTEPTPPAARNDGLAIAVLPNYLAVASTAKPLEQWIDTQSGTTSLAENPHFQRTLQNAQFEQALLVSYGDLAGLSEYLAAAATIPTPTPVPVPVPIPAPSPDDFKEITKVYSTIDALTWVAPEGIHSQTNTYYTTPQPNFATVDLPNANQIVSRVPAATYLSANSRNFKQQWQSFATEIDADPASQFITKGIRDAVRSATGLDLDQDLVPWMDGQYVFFMFPTNQGLFPSVDRNFRLGLSIMVQTSDRPAAEAALEKFTQYVKSQPGTQLSITNQTVKGQPIVSWEGVDGPRRISIFSHAWVNDDTLVLTTGAGPMTALNPKPYIPLDQTPTFQTATESLPKPNEGFFYVNLGSSLSFLYGLLLPNFNYGDSPEIRQVKQILGIFRSVSTTNSATAEKQQFDSLLVIAPARK